MRGENVSQAPPASTASAPFPRNAAEVAPAWLTDTLRRAGVLLATGSVRQVTAESIGAGAGIAGSLARLALTCDGAAASGVPESVVAKFSAADDRTRATMGALLGVYEREVRFYSYLAGRVGVATPRCYFAAFDPDTQHSVLLLEDLSGAKFGPDDESCSQSEGEAAILAIAGMHAAWWESPEAGALSWLWREQEPPAEVWQHTSACFPRFRERFSDAVSPELWPVLTRVASGGQVHFSGANTLYHGDFSPKNVCFEGSEPLIFDWQVVGYGPPALDLVRFMAAPLHAPDPRYRIESLLATYHNALTGAGVTGYPLDTLKRDCMAATALRLHRPIAIGGGPGELDNVRTATVLRELEDSAKLLDGVRPEELFE